MSELSVADIVEIVESPADESIQEVEALELSREQLERLLEAEKAGQNRKEFVEFLEKEMEKDSIEEEIQEAEKELEDLEESLEDYETGEEKEIDRERVLEIAGSTVEELEAEIEKNSYSEESLRRLLETEKKVNDRDRAQKIIEDKIREIELSKDSSRAVEEIERLEEDLEEVESDLESKEEVESLGFEEKLRQEIRNLDDAGKEEKPEEEGVAEAEEPEEDEEPEEQAEDVEGDGGNLEEKKEIAEELGIDMEEAELEDTSIEQLRSLKEEKDRREELIARLTDEDFEEEKLREASTADLQKLAEGLEETEEENQDSEEESGGDEEEGEDTCSDEQIEEEAEEDLMMLMGAKRDSTDEEEDESPGLRERIEEKKKDLKDSLPFSGGAEDETSSGLTASKVVELLEEYSEQGQKAATIETVHVMKSFLEKKLEIEREMTYMELADSIEDKNQESLDELADYFRKLHRSQYKGQKAIDDTDRMIEVAKDAARDLK